LRMLGYLYWKRFGSKIFEPNFSSINIPTFLKPIHSSYLPAYEDGTECFETLAYKIQTPGKYPEESIQQRNDLHKGNLRTTARTLWLRNVTTTPNIKIQT